MSTGEAVPPARAARAASGGAFALAASAVLAAGCVPLKMPDPVEVPALAEALAPAPEFTVLAPDLTEVASSAFSGRVLVVVGVLPGFMRDSVAWLEFLTERYGPPDGTYAVLILAERARPADLLRLDLPAPEGVDLHADPADAYRTAFGFVGEGPHVAVVGPDGALLALVDGPPLSERMDGLCFAMDAVLSPRQASAEAE